MRDLTEVCGYFGVGNCKIPLYPASVTNWLLTNYTAAIPW
uniref:Uncharacterized protein n=1 Tax=Siphoviridae sp. ctFBb37 TaxID=2827565 RepID=A0A8S5RSQ1_9CAUD|nr:MAG TPA: hypothetical protein [Siphoviridae sp. ctFBb37]